MIRRIGYGISRGLKNAWRKMRGIPPVPPVQKPVPPRPSQDHYQKGSPPNPPIYGPQKPPATGLPPATRKPQPGDAKRANDAYGPKKKPPQNRLDEQA